MITPSFNLTATERVLPKLALDFTTASLDSRVSFTRASNTATRVNSLGLIELVNADLPRFDFNPVTLVCRGLLIEETRVNFLLQSEAFGTSPWTTASQNASITQNSTTSPDGQVTADTFTDNATSAIHRVSQTVTTANTNQKVFSCFAKYSSLQWITLSASTSTGTWAGAKFDIQNGVLGSISQQGAGWTANSSSITNFGNGWFRCVLVYTPGASGATPLLVSGATDGTTFTTSQRGSEVYSGTDSSAFVWGAQLEDGAFATSYIPTVASQVTRSADVATMTGTNFSDWFNATEGTFVAKSDTVDATNFPKTLYAGTANDAVYLDTRTVSVRSIIVAATVAVLAKTSTKLAVNIFSAAYKLNSHNAGFNGAAVTAATSGAIPTGITSMSIGSGLSSNFANGHIYRIDYYPQRLTDAELRAFTK
jgi:hypothetical protein